MANYSYPYMKNLASIVSAVVLLCIGTVLISGILFKDSDSADEQAEKERELYPEPPPAPAPAKPAPAPAPSQSETDTMKSLTDIPSKPPEERTVYFDPNSEVQNLISKDGRKIQAKIIDVNEDSVTVFRPDLYKRFTLSRDSLDSDSQQLLDEWYSFYNPSPTTTSTIVDSEDGSVPFDNVDWDEVFK